ncbi:PUA-like domain-containing protein [Lineolata rhizophorae]|uniref:PUA-like domain-containing protein n=1 Tax=Lineolata rhizophorae TaxID=578093 RepID=A0A6A6NSI0_9PEZI|nr:PUA-like domain-containing protein [Lineolata rhizophorae]
MPPRIDKEYAWEMEHEYQREKAKWTTIINDAFDNAPHDDNGDRPYPKILDTLPPEASSASAEPCTLVALECEKLEREYQLGKAKWKQVIDDAFENASYDDNGVRQYPNIPETLPAGVSSISADSSTFAALERDYRRDKAKWKKVVDDAFKDAENDDNTAMSSSPSDGQLTDSDERVSKRARNDADTTASASRAKAQRSNHVEAAKPPVLSSLPSFRRSTAPKASNVPLNRPAESQESPPQWYCKLKFQGLKFRPATVNYFKQLQEALKAPKVDFNHVRSLVHKFKFTEATAKEIRGARMLHNDGGLKRLISPAPGIHVPWDIRADAEELYHKWAMEDFDTDLLRGIDMRTSVASSTTKKYGTIEDSRATDRIRKDYPGRRYAYHYGNNGHVNGSWYPTQLSMVRDGLHGATQGGIYGERSKGVYSIILSGGNHYEDEDNGDDIWYTGTDSTEGKGPTDSTQHMLETAQLPFNERKPIRVIRATHLKVANRYRPRRGFRYDGLYDMVDYESVDRSKESYRFRLKRCPGQDPIRFEGVEARPTDEEIAAYDKLRSARRVE